MALAALAGSLTSAAVAATAQAAAKPTYYVAVGDSYAEGYQPGYTDNSETLVGYTNQVPALVASKKNLTLVNFGCGGATSNSILNSVSCGAPATNAPAYPTKTQTAAAVAFIKAHPGQIGLVTISIGGNDFDGCINDASPVDCVNASMPVMKQNVNNLANQLRDAAGPTVPMIATTYPDVLLGAYLNGSSGQSLANESVLAFSLIVNPYLKLAYVSSNTSFLDITAQTGAYLPLTQTTTLAPYGKIPQAVANVCTLTWFCTNGDIHPKAAGYTFIAHSVATEYLRLVGLKKTKAPVGSAAVGGVHNVAPSSLRIFMNVTVPRGDAIVFSTLRLCGTKQVAPKCTSLFVTVPNVGTFSAGTYTGEVQYNPVAGYVGTTTPINYQAYDAFGQLIKGSASFVVTNP